MRILLTLGAFGFVVVGALVIKADEPDGNYPQVKSFWMTQKLEVSKELLAALSVEDYDAIAEQAVKMKRLSRLEELARRDHTGEYGRELRLFQRTVDMLALEAKEEYLDGATLAFTQMTLSCVNCHRHLRRVAPAHLQRKMASNAGLWR